MLFTTIGSDLGLSDPIFKKWLEEERIDPDKQSQEAGAMWIDIVWHGRAHSWEKMPWLIKTWKDIAGEKPFCLKDIQSVDDAKRAVEVGCDGICYDNSVTVRAAWNTDSNILHTVLQHGHPYYSQGQDLAEDNEYGPNAVNSPDIPGYTSALLQAITSQHPENVTILFSAGTDPNNLSRRSLSQNAAGFLSLGPHLQSARTLWWKTCQPSIGTIS